MKKIGITQRADDIPSYHERRDALDRHWIELCHLCNLLPVVIPNHLPTVQALTHELSLEGFILTGGNSLSVNGGHAPERDEAELFLIEYALKNDFPIFGVCRGMELIQHFFGVPLYEVEGHVGQDHQINFGNENYLVNSYHRFGTRETFDDLVVIARAEDGVIEAIEHRKYRIKGVMWHPERNMPFHTHDISLMTHFFQ